jgi:photosystem II stability/assembly factor-like uncharacterized protein
LADAFTGYAICASAVSPYDSGFVYKTTDAGETWNQVHYDVSTGFLGLGVLDASTVYAGGLNQTIIKTQMEEPHGAQ